MRVGEVVVRRVGKGRAEGCMGAWMGVFRRDVEVLEGYVGGCGFRDG